MFCKVTFDVNLCELGKIACKIEFYVCTLLYVKLFCAAILARTPWKKIFLSQWDYPGKIKD